MKTKYFLLALAISPLVSWSQQQKFLVLYRNKNLWGFCDTLGKVVIEPAYDSTGFNFSFYGGFAEMGQIYSGGKEGMISFSGKVLVAPVYDRVDYYRHLDYFEVTQKGSVGIIDTYGKLILDVQYKAIYPINGKRSFKLFKDHKVGLFNRQNSLIIEPQFDEISEDYKSDVSNRKNFIARKGNQTFTINCQTFEIIETTGTVKAEYGVIAEIPPVVEEYSKPQLTTIDIQKLKTLFDAVEIISMEKMNGNSFGQSLWGIRKNNKIGIIDWWTKKIVLPAVYDTISYAMAVSTSDFLKEKSRYLFAVKKDGKYGIVNEKGNEIVPFEFSEIRSLKGYRDGFEVIKKGKCGAYLPYTSYPMIKTKYDQIRHLHSLPVNPSWTFGIFVVIKKGKTGYLGENGVEYFRF